MTGVGYPQLSATIECADAASWIRRTYYHRRRVYSCGGYSKKGFGAGADFVMLGGMFAGHDECHGKIEGNNVYKQMEFYGMSSDKAQIEYYGEKQDYRASEGKVVWVDYVGPVKNTVEEMLGGLRSALTYAGARCIKDLPKCTTFVRVNRQLNEIYS